MRSHPPTLITLARRALREECGVVPGVTVLVAASGGPDSQALLDVLARLRRELRFELAAHGVDHGLRPEAGAELDLAEALAARHGVSFGRTRVSVTPGGNLQARARAARYEALRRAAEGLRAQVLLATAHHADDRAETVLLRLLRGAGPRGLAVLAPRAGERIRPFWRATRGDVMQHLARHSVPFAQDPSNQSSRFLRARVRQELLPLLSDLSPRIVGHLNALADALIAESEEASWHTEECQDDAETGRCAAVAGALNRAQLEAVARAYRLERPVRIRASGGRELELRVIRRERNERGTPNGTSKPRDNETI